MHLFNGTFSLPLKLLLNCQNLHFDFFFLRRNKKNKNTQKKGDNADMRQNICPAPTNHQFTK